MKPSGSVPAYAYPGSRHCQLGVSSWSESQRSVRQELATSARSRTTWSMERVLRPWLIARPPCPAPMTTVVVRTGPAVLTRVADRSDDFDRDVRGVGDDVEDR